MDGMLSQDEINALLNGMNNDDDADANVADTVGSCPGRRIHIIR